MAEILCHAIPVIAVAPQFTSQDCSACGTLVKKALSERTHVCHHCGLVLDRDQNAACNILNKAYRTVGHTATGLSEERRTLLDIGPLLSGSNNSEQAG